MTDSVTAVVLAAGEGRRLDPLTNKRPKPMVPIANRPLLEYVVEAVAEAGIDRIVLVVGYRRERIRNHFGDGDEWGIAIEYVEQKNQLGTGHAVLQTEASVTGPFVVLNGDRIVDSDIVERVRETLLTQSEPVVAVRHSETPSKYGVIDLDGQVVTDVTEKPVQPTGSQVINAGVYGFMPEMFSTIRETSTTGELAITDTLSELAKDHLVHAVRYSGRWLDVSYLWDVPRVNADLVSDRSELPDDERTDVSVDASVVSAPDVAVDSGVSIGPNVTLGGGTALGENATIGAGVVLSNAVIFPDATIEAGAVVRDSVIASNATIGANTTIDGGDATVIVDGSVYEDVDFGGAVGDNAVIGSGVTLAPGAVVGDGAELDAGIAVGGRIEPDAVVRRG